MDHRQKYIKYQNDFKLIFWPKHFFPTVKWISKTDWFRYGATEFYFNTLWLIVVRDKAQLLIGYGKLNDQIWFLKWLSHNLTNTYIALCALKPCNTPNLWNMRPVDGKLRTLSTSCRQQVWSCRHTSYQ